MDERDPEDLTARARIRDAAMRQFGELGFERATIRGIAEAAGVSSGLVRHHFGSKQALREACDDYLVKQIRGLSDQVHADPLRTGGNYVAMARQAMGAYQPYLARALLEGQATFVFDELSRLMRQWLAELDKTRPDPPRADLNTRAAILTARTLSVGVLHEHISRVVGVPIFSPEGDLLLARALTDIYAHPLMTQEDAERVHARLDSIQGSANTHHEQEPSDD